MDRKNLAKIENFRDYSRGSAPDQKFFEAMFLSLSKHIQDSYNISVPELIKKTDDDVLIPISIFVREIGALESICRYLKESRKFKNKRIAELIGRDSKSVWQAIDKGQKKYPKKLATDSEDPMYYIPVSIIRNRSLGVLENIVVYLKEKFAFSYREIAELLKRDERTIWTVYNRSLKKRKIAGFGKKAADEKNMSDKNMSDKIRMRPDVR